MDFTFTDDISGGCDTYDECVDYDMTWDDDVEYVEAPVYEDFVVDEPCVVVDGWVLDDGSWDDGSWTSEPDPAAVPAVVETTVALPAPAVGTADVGSVWQPVSAQQAAAWGVGPVWQPVAAAPDASAVTAQMQNEAATNRLLMAQLNQADNGKSIPGLYGESGARNWMERTPNYSTTYGSSW